MTLRDIVEEAKKLPRDEQVDLIDELYRMIHVDPDDVTLTPAQAADLDRRIDELESGRAKVATEAEVEGVLRKRR